MPHRILLIADPSRSTNKIDDECPEERTCSHMTTSETPQLTSLGHYCMNTLIEKVVQIIYPNQKKRTIVLKDGGEFNWSLAMVPLLTQQTHENYVFLPDKEGSEREPVWERHSGSNAPMLQQQTTCRSECRSRMCYVTKMQSVTPPRSILCCLECAWPSE